MRILVCGGRDFTDHIKFNREMIRIVAEHIPHFGRDWGLITVIHGAARGADTLASLWAKSFGTHVEAYPANWDVHGVKAGVLRNQLMLDTGVDLVVAFPGGNGTADMVRRAKKAEVPVVMVGG